MPASYAYLGPEGTFTEAALRTLPESATRELVPMVSVPAAVDAVRAGEAEAAFVPIENSVEGGITTTLDELVAGAPLMIYREVLLSITFALLGRPGTKLSDIKTVTAHPAAQPHVRDLLGEFATRGINLMLLQSRPTGAGIGNYCFCIDAEGHISDRRVAETLMGLKRICLEVRFLGSYPRADAGVEDVSAPRPGTSDEEFVSASDWVARCQDGRF